jgi:glyoxylase-like metal-dependent hydrolase (beta-lactamase superfamily II)
MQTSLTSTAPKSAPNARLSKHVAPGVHRLEHAHVNCYILEGDDRAEGVTLVDTAFPATWPLLLKALEAIGRRPDEVRAAVLTHAHFDHLGMARRLRDEWNVPVLGHPRDAYIAEHPYRYAHESSRLVYPFRYPATLPVILRMVRAGALRVRGLSGLRSIEPLQQLDIPGRPRVVFTPGHTYGHCALELPGRNVLLTGDALVTFNPYTAEEGPQVVSGAATADLEMAFLSLDALAVTGAGVLLPGHGEPWRQGAEAAVAEARLRGPS